MIKLEREKEPYCRVQTKGPHPGIRTNMKTEQNEHQGTFLVFAFPELVPWPPNSHLFQGARNDHKINWLFSPPTGSKWKGDLWGIDDNGELLIIESKTKKGITKSRDPLKEFVTHDVAEIEKLQNDWNDLLAQERFFLKCAKDSHEDHLSIEYPRRNPSTGQTAWPGVVEYSSRRTEARRWCHIYLETIAPKIESGEYEERAKCNLQNYSKNRAPHYFALFTLYGDDEPQMPDESYYRLVERLDERVGTGKGKDHVHFFAVQRDSCYFDEPCEIRSYIVRPPTTRN